LRSRIRFTFIISAGLLLLSGCGDSSGSAAQGGSANTQVTAKPSGTVTVLAAASLTEAFTGLGKSFEATNPGTNVKFSFAGSSALATQINQGAPADVFASAAPANMTTVVNAGNISGTPVVFARNQLVIAVAKGNPKRIKNLSDLAAGGIKVALCAEQVPCGAAAKQAIAAAGTKITPVTLEPDVKSALSKVKMGEVDAALVYRTDVKSSGQVDGVEFPESAQAINDYPIATCKNAPNPSGATAFLAYIRSEAGRTALTSAGFQVP
jgi:molybdate transport system substrate-binding protein